MDEKELFEIMYYYLYTGGYTTVFVGPNSQNGTSQNCVKWMDGWKEKREEEKMLNLKLQGI